MSAKKLTPKETAFCEEYIIDFNATQAAIRAGYSKNCAKEIGYENLTKPHISQRVNANLDARENRIQIRGDDIVRMLLEEATADTNDLYDEEGQLLPIDQWPLPFRRGLVAGIEVEEVYEGSGSDRQCVGELKKIKLADRNKTKELLGRHFKLFTDNHTLSNADGSPVNTVFNVIGVEANHEDG